MEGALDRITPEITKRNRAFGINLAIMAAEMRAGRAFVEALDTLAGRLMIPAAQSLVAVLRQSSELGSDVWEALRVFGDELRDKRLLRAEEEAGKLSVKMLVPLTFFIFPVVLMVIALPLVVSMVKVFLPLVITLPGGDRQLDVIPTLEDADSSSLATVQRSDAKSLFNFR